MSLIQHNSASVAAGTACLPLALANVGANHTLVWVTGAAANAFVDSPPLDSTGQVWTKAYFFQANTPQNTVQAAYYLLNANAGNHTVTANNGIDSYFSSSLLEIPQATGVDVVGGQKNGNGAITGITANLTPAGSNVAIIAGVVINAGSGNANAAITLPTGFTAVFTQNATNAFAGAQHAYRELAGNASVLQNITWNFAADTTNSTYIAAALSFTFPSTTQTLTPSADLVTGNWVSSVGAALFTTLDDPIRDDTDYALLSGLVGSTFKIALSAGNSPGSNVPHVISYAMAATAGNMNVRLVQDANTTIAQWAHVPVTNNFTQADQTLSNAQIALITNYANLSLEFRAY